jgi:amidohydrolase
VPLLADAHALQPDIVAWRRHLHAHPELAYQEVATAAFARAQLEALGLAPSPPLATTGFTCLIEGRADGPTVALRADMDALPIQEENDVPYASTVPGVGHMCGHDAHTAMLLGAAALLARHRPERGHVKLLFQPAEEGGAGAERMIAEGALDAPEVSAAFALHVHHTAAAGFVTVCPGQAMAAADSFDLEVVGSGGHAAHPHLSVDAIAVAAELVSALQQIASRHTDPLKPLVVTIGRIEGGFARNVIAPSVRLEGTVRTLDAELRARVPELLERTAHGVTAAFGAQHRLDYRFGYPPTRNDPTLVPTLGRSVAALLGEDRLATAPPSMGAEDFAYYAERVPGLMFRLGVRNEGKGIVHPLHHPRFDVDEEVLPLGSALLADVALRWLAER